ncbi:MAG: DUF1788 domain-containing protein [Chloroflexi bacterium]|nr:DUF1788 domain-containing protein [Chloroflexota bacterium]
MPSLRDNFDELMERVRVGRELGHASYEPIYYLIFSPKAILDVKRSLPAWIAKLRNEGWDVHVFSIAQEIEDILSHAPMMKIWVAADSKAPLAWERANQSLANAITNGSLRGRLAAKLEQLKEKKNAILLVTDLEALHPYTRIGAIESQLYGKFYVPTVFLYPGEGTGKTRLKFLGFYPEDGNYRSVHVGG